MLIFSHKLGNSPIGRSTLRPQPAATAVPLSAAPLSLRRQPLPKISKKSPVAAAKQREFTALFSFTCESVNVKTCLLVVIEDVYSEVTKTLWNMSASMKKRPIINM